MLGYVSFQNDSWAAAFYYFGYVTYAPVAKVKIETWDRSEK